MADFTNEEKEMINKGINHWKKVIPKEKYPKGGYISTETLEYTISNIVDDVWSKAKEFYKNKTK